MLNIPHKLAVKLELTGLVCMLDYLRYKLEQVPEDLRLEISEKCADMFWRLDQTSYCVLCGMHAWNFGVFGGDDLNSAGIGGAGLQLIQGGVINRETLRYELNVDTLDHIQQSVDDDSRLWIQLMVLAEHMLAKNYDRSPLDSTRLKKRPRGCIPLIAVGARVFRAWNERDIAEVISDDSVACAIIDAWGPSFSTEQVFQVLHGLLPSDNVISKQSIEDALGIELHENPDIERAQRFSLIRIGLGFVRKLIDEHISETKREA